MANDAPAENTPPTEPEKISNFVADIVETDVAAGKNEGRLHTRFPPEPNGYLHIGHAKSICLNFGLAEKSPGGKCNLRFDDTNPTAEDIEFVESIQEDVKWLGFDWQDRLFFASDYFEQLYAWAEKLIEEGKAYVDDQTLDAIRAGRGNFYTPGKNSPFRDRSAAENLDLFRRMRAGEFPDGARVLRAKIDMAHANVNMRDPLMYRIRHAHHHRTGDKWCIYPIYDYTHGQSDAIEGITHSVCTLEFEDHRPLYEWYLEQIQPKYRPRQIEFARLNLTYTVMSKRRMKELVEDKLVEGWDDPRMPTLAGLRRRGFTPQALRNFCGRIAVSKRPGIVDVSLLEYALREDLNLTSPRAFAVLNPLKIVIENYPEGQTEDFEGAYNPEDPAFGSRKLPFSREIFIERDDFREDSPKQWFRLAPGKEVRLRYACIIKCESVVKDAEGNIVELRCTWDPASRGGNAADGRKIKGTIHWVSVTHSVPAEVRIYDRLFNKENPMEIEGAVDADEDSTAVGNWKANINPNSLTVLHDARIEPALKDAAPGSRFQFERLGYFCVDKDSKSGKSIWNRTISLRDSWAKLEKKLNE